MSAVFDLQRPWRLHEAVALRPEPFGALAYHYGTRRLSFLKALPLVEVVRRLADAQNAQAALDAEGIAESKQQAYVQALARLAESGMIVPRDEL